MVGCKNPWQNKNTSLKWVWLLSLLICFTLPNRLFTSPSNKWHVSSAADPVYFCFQLCLLHMQEDALFDVLLPLSFFLLSLWCLMVQQTQSFFTPWTVTLLKHLFKIISVWLCHHIVTKYFYGKLHYFSIWVQFEILYADYCILSFKLSQDFL